MPPERYADIHVEQLPNGYWSAEITVKLQGRLPFENEGSVFHDAGEALNWALQQIGLVIAHG